MAANSAPKQWSLTKTETLLSFEAWKDNLLYRLSLDVKFSQLLMKDARWGKESRTGDQTRGFIDDTQVDIAGQQVVMKSAATKAAELRLFLGQIANFAPIISRGTITKNCQSLNEIWQELRTYYGFQSTGAHFLDLSSIKRKPTERPEELYHSILSFVEDSLLTTNCGIKHLGEDVNEDEEVSPTLLNFVVLIWLEKIHPELPQLVKQKYATTLKNQTLASIKNEISMSMDALLEELQTLAEVKVMRVNSQFKKGPKQSKTQFIPNCKICRLENRTNTDHFLSKCPFLPKADKEYFTTLLSRKSARVRQVGADDPTVELATSEEDESGESKLEKSKIRRVPRKASPVLLVTHNNVHIPLTLDTGAESTLIHVNTAMEAKMPITKTSQRAFQADGNTPLTVIGETQTSVHHADKNLELSGLVVSDLDVPILGGTPFLESNDITIRPAQHTIKIKESHTCPDYNFPCTNDLKEHLEQPSLNRVALRIARTTTLWPGDNVQITVPGAPTDQQFDLAFEPSGTCIQQLPNMRSWPNPEILSCIDGQVSISNDSSFPIRISKNAHLGSITSTYQPEETTAAPAVRSVVSSSPADNTSLILVDPDNILSSGYASKFSDINQKHSIVFDSDAPGYNGAVGDIKAVVNMGPTLPPQRKGKLPLYQPKRLQELQDKFDLLESRGIFVKPEDVGVHCEYVNPSFLVNSPGKPDSRLVTAFTDVGRYAKPQPSLMSNTEDTLRVIGRWKYVIKSDLTKAFFQIPLDQKSLKYCGVVTPFRGIRLYARAAMGMPGSETALEELMSRVLGDFLYSGAAAKVADDLFCGSDSLDELLVIWDNILQSLEKCSLRLSATKTVICPRSTVILGWVWTDGHLSASKHRISALASCPPPSTVKATRSFVGAYKILSRVIKNTAPALAPFEELCAGRASQDRIDWTADLVAKFENAQELLKSPATIVIPRPTDTLWIVTDGATSHGIGSTLYLSRKDKLLCGGFFSAKLKSSKAKNTKPWLPCEIEALSIASCIRHFAPLIVQSNTTCHVLTDSKPCVQAYQRMQRGHFSTSPRLSTLLSEASHRQVTISHISGAVNLPSDFASRNAPPCDSPTCQVCSFVRELEDATVMRLSVQDVLDGKANLPFTNRPAWKSTQQSDPDTRRALAQLKQGTRPGKKDTKIKDVKRYLQVCSRSKDDLLVVKRTYPLSPSRDLIVVPRSSVAGLLTAIHIRLDHPTQHQLKLTFSRFFFALDLDRHAQQVTESCHTCASLKRLPEAVFTQSSCPPPTCVGTSFAADVMKLPRQSILLLRETVSSYTTACSVDNEREETLYSGLVQLCTRIRPIDGPPARIRVDPAPGFVAIANNSRLNHLNITLEIGSPKNPNKNPVAESTVAEMRQEIKRQFADHGALTPDKLEIVCQRLNSRIRSRGFSSYEMMFGRDQFSNEPVDVNDVDLIRSQKQARLENHKFSETSKLRQGRKFPNSRVAVGDLVYLFVDKDKLSARPRYIVASVDKNSGYCEIRKLSKQFRNKIYKIRFNECYKVPQYTEFEPTFGKMSEIFDVYSEDEDSQEFVDCTKPPGPGNRNILNRSDCSLPNPHSGNDLESELDLGCPGAIAHDVLTPIDDAPNSVTPPADLTRPLSSDTMNEHVRNDNRVNVDPSDDPNSKIVPEATCNYDVPRSFHKYDDTTPDSRPKRVRLPNVRLKDYILY